MEWTDEIIARLRELWDEGHSTAEIGRRLGFSKNAVVGKAHRLDLPARPSPIRRETVEAAAAPRSEPVTTLPPLPSDTQPLAPPMPVTAPVVAEPVPPPVAATPVMPPVLPPRPATPRPAPVTVPPRMQAVTPRPYARIVTCCWPIGEPGTRSFHFCDDPSEPGKPYCSEHAKLAYVKVRDRREDAA
jgi:GcrA cell cycle regulator